MCLDVSFLGFAERRVHRQLQLSVLGMFVNFADLRLQTPDIFLLNLPDYKICNTAVPLTFLFSSEYIR